MNKAIRITASALGTSAGIAGLEHGYFEFLQGNIRPESLMISSIGPPCQPELSWNNCEPAMTIIPNFLLTGILALALGLTMIIWSVAFVQRKNGGLVLILLSIGLLLFGGGLFPPLIGTIAGLVATRINKTLTWSRAHLGRGLTQWLAKLYPLALIAYLVVVFGQFIVGHFFNNFLMAYMGFNVLLIMGFLLLSILSALAHDVHEQSISIPAPSMGGKA